jgi:dihydrofolate reductase
LSAHPKIVLVAGMARDRTIGKGGKIPWHYPDDMRFFKVVTMGTALVMGRKTFESIGRALPGRDNIVITRDPKALAKAQPGILTASSLDDAIALATTRGAKAVSVIGGGEIYEAALPIADAMVLTYVPEDGGGDVFFPEFDESGWRQTSREKRGRVTVVRWARR